MKPGMIAYGAECTWWDTLDRAAEQHPDGACNACGKVHQLAIPLRCQRGEITPHHGVPVCPHCGARLYMMTADDWWHRIHEQELTLPLFGELARWARGRCYPDFDTLSEAFHTARLQATA